MTDFTREIDAHYPTNEDIEAIMKEARRLRSRAMRDGAISIWSMLQRSVARKAAPAAAC